MTGIINLSTRVKETSQAMPCNKRGVFQMKYRKNSCDLPPREHVESQNNFVLTGKGLSKELS